MGISSFKNDIGVKEIQIGTKGFVCIGETPPMDHPHIYLTMGEENHKVCLYCNTKYVYNPALSIKESVPNTCYHGELTVDKLSK